MLQHWKGLKRPSELQCDLDTLTPTFGTFWAEPFEKGFGVTIGNSLRRILLSSLLGAAVKSIRIEGILHEFAPIPSVKEDVTDFIINVKGITFQLHGEGTHERTVYLNVDTPGEVTAGDIECPPDLEVLNPDHYLCTLDPDAKLNVEMAVGVGRGYVSNEQNRDEDMPIGTIPIDALFSPVRKVSFHVENTRVDHNTEFERLYLSVDTNGSLAPEEAVRYAAVILRDHYEIFIGNELTLSETPLEEEGAEVETVEIAEVFTRLLENIDSLSNRSINCLNTAGINTIGDLVQRTEDEIQKTPNFGKKSMTEVQELLESLSLDFGMSAESLTTAPTK